MKPLVLIAILLTAGVAQAQSPQDLLQEALRLERSQGDLSGAIAIYEQITDDPAGERGTTATALFHLGKAYEALGRDEATRAYRRLVREYAEYSDLVAGAQERLRGLAPPSVRSASATLDGPRIREVELPQKVLDRGFWGAALTPDGRYILNISWAESPKLDLTMTEIDTGEVQYLGVAGKGRVAESGGLASWPAFPRMAPDMNRVAYLVGKNEEPLVDLRVLNRQTGGIRTVLEQTPYLELFGWTADGQHILAMAVLADDINDPWLKAQTFISIDVRSGEIESVFESEGILDPLCHPAGEGFLLASRYGADTGRNVSAGLVRIDLESGARTEAPSPPFDVSWLSCTADHVYATSEVFGTPSLIRWKLEDGLPVGDQEFVTSASGLSYALNSAANGRVLVEGSSSSLLHLAPVDAASGRLHGPIEAYGNRYTYGVHGWSPDGRVLSAGPGFGAMRFIDIETVSEYPLRDIELEYGGYPGRLMWMPDGNSAVVSRNFFLEQSPKKRAVLVDISNGQTMRELGEHILLDVIDSTRLLVETRPSTSESCLEAFDFETEDSRVLHCGPYHQWDHRPAYNFADVSWDRKQAAIIVEERNGEARRRKLMTVDLASGDVDLKLDIPRVERSISRPVWLPDGSGVVFSEVDLTTEKVGYKVINFSTSEVRPWMEILGSYERLSGLAIHPDGKQVAFTAWPPGKQNRLLVIEGM